MAQQTVNSAPEGNVSIDFITMLVGLYLQLSTLILGCALSVLIIALEKSKY